MKQKKIVLDSCNAIDCPHFGYTVEDDGTYAICLLTNELLTEEDKEVDFPEWCPLDDD